MHYMIYFLGLPVSKSLYRKTRYIFCHVLVCRVREIQYSLNEKCLFRIIKEKLSYHFYSVINTGVSSILTIGKLKLLLGCFFYIIQQNTE